MARRMGDGKTFQDFKCNVHIAGKAGPAGIKDALKRLSPEARNIITIENDEISWGIDASLELANDCALVLDIHNACNEWAWEFTQDFDIMCESKFKQFASIDFYNKMTGNNQSSFICN